MGECPASDFLSGGNNHPLLRALFIVKVTTSGAKVGFIIKESPTFFLSEGNNNQHLSVLFIVKVTTLGAKVGFIIKKCALSCF